MARRADIDVNVSGLLNDLNQTEHELREALRRVSRLPSIPHSPEDLALILAGWWNSAPDLDRPDLEFCECWFCRSGDGLP